MANRSYLYALRRDDEEKPLRDLSEWKTHIPVTHKLLLSGNPRTCSSEIWSIDEGHISVEGDVEEGRARFDRFFDWMMGLDLPKGDELAEEVRRAQELLDKPEKQGEVYHLEAGEVFQLYCTDVDEIISENARLVGEIQRLAADVDRLVAQDGATLADADVLELRDLAGDWERENLGLYFPGVLYFHFG